jgi:hypothetical protein
MQLQAKVNTRGSGVREAHGLSLSFAGWQDTSSRSPSETHIIALERYQMQKRQAARQVQLTQPPGTK